MEDARKKAGKDLVEGRLSEPVRTDAKGRVKESVHLDLSKQQQLITGDEGLVAKLADALSTRDSSGRPKQRDFQSAVWLAGLAKKALDHDGYAAVDAERSEALKDLKAKVDLLSQYAKRRVARERTFLDDLKKTGPSSIQGAVKDAVAAQRRFETAWWANPPDRFRPLLYDKMIDQIIHRARITDRIGNLDERLRDPKKSDDWNTKQIARVHSDPRVLAQTIWQESKAATTNIGGAQLLSDSEREAIYHSAVDEVNALREQGHEVGYVPVVSSTDISERNPGRYGVGITKRAVIKDLSMSQRRVMDDFMPERYDLLASVHMATKEALERDVTIEFVDTHRARTP